MKWLRSIQTILEMIKFEHTIFALPFAYMGAIIGSLEVHQQFPTWAQIGWITLAMIGARSAAMALNRLIDRHIDARNPRTQNRAIPKGLVSVSFVWGFVVCSFVLLFFAAAQLNELSVALLPVAVFLLVFYSYTKRFTWWCHIFLGLATAAGPMGGWVAVTGEVNGVALLLYVSVALWIGGFDVIYACQDVQFDKKAQLHSIPARFGIRKALWISAWMHVGTAFGLLSLFFLTQLNLWYGVGIIIAILILIYEHAIVKADDLSRLNTSFFTMNGILSMIVFLFTMVDVLI